MNNETYTRKQININDIILNIENPRFEKVNSQEEALKVMVQEYEDKIYNLAKHITENGMNPTELSAVIKSNNNKYTILDGNRRLTTLRILMNPSLLDQDFEGLKTKILKLDKTNIPSTINAIEFESEEEANLWIKLKHTGENSGIGTVGWNSLQQSRFDNDKYPLSIQLIRYMDNNDLMEPSLIESIDDLKISNLDRMLTDPDIRNMLSLKHANKILYFPAATNDMKKLLNNLLNDVLSETFSVNTIRSKDDRLNYIESFKHKHNIRDEDIEALNKLETSSIKDQVEEQKQKAPQIEKQIQEVSKENNKMKNTTETKQATSIPIEYPNTQSRTKLIPTDFILAIRNTKINDIYGELKKVNINEYPNMIGSAFRVFLELSLDYYILERNLPAHHTEVLSNKLNKVKTDINKTLNLDRELLKNINRAISSNQDLVSIDVLHGYVHSSIAQANPDGLKHTWNNYQLFFNLLYKVLSEYPVAK